MSNAFDVATDGGVITSTSLSWSHTCSGLLRFLVVGFNGDSVGGADDITGVTYNGVAMTLGVKKINATSGDRMLYLYYLIGPASGANTVTISCSSSHNLSGGSVSYTGVKQSAQPDATITNFSGSTATTLTTAIVTSANNSWAVLLEGGYDNNNPPTAGAGLTIRKSDGTFGAWGLFDSNSDITPAGSYSMTTNRGTNPFNLAITHVALSMSPDTGGVTPVHYLGSLDCGA